MLTWFGFGLGSGLGSGLGLGLGSGIGSGIGSGLGSVVRVRVRVLRHAHQSMQVTGEADALRRRLGHHRVSRPRGDRTHAMAAQRGDRGGLVR
eukprot:scaffold129918_cov51-Phaeocystis_antarctica.AAC.1